MPAQAGVGAGAAANAAAIAKAIQQNEAAEKKKDKFFKTYKAEHANMSEAKFDSIKNMKVRPRRHLLVWR